MRGHSREIESAIAREIDSDIVRRCPPPNLLISRKGEGVDVAPMGPHDASPSG